MKRLFVGRLDKRTRTGDIEDVFEMYGRLARCEVKYGSDTAYAFVDYERDQDAEEALQNENGRKLNGATMVVEWAKGRNTRAMDMECYRCHRRGHAGRDCPEDRYRGRYDDRRRRSRSRSNSRSRSYRRRMDSRSRSRSLSPSHSRSRSRSRSHD